MQLIFLLIVLFVLGCLLYGIYAGVSAIGRIGARMGEQEQRPIPCPFCWRCCCGDFCQRHCRHKNARP